MVQHTGSDPWRYDDRLTAPVRGEYTRVVTRHVERVVAWQWVQTEWHARALVELLDFLARDGGDDPHERPGIVPLRDRARELAAELSRMARRRSPSPPETRSPADDGGTPETTPHP